MFSIGFSVISLTMKTGSVHDLRDVNLLVVYLFLFLNRLSANCLCDVSLVTSSGIFGSVPSPSSL